MPTSPSTRLGLVGPNGATDLLSSGDDMINAIIAQLEAVNAGYKIGTSRPAASAALAGYIYINTSSGLISVCTGASWIDLNPAGVYELLDSDLVSIAALSTNDFGRNLLTLANAAAARTAIEAGRRILVPDLSAVSTYTFSGLDGDNDRQYRLGLSGVFAISAVDRAISIRPAPSGGAGSTANYFDSVFRQDWWDGSMQTLEGEYRGDGFGFLLAMGNSWGTYGANHVIAEALIEARRKTGTPRAHKASWSSSPDAVTERQLMGQAGGNWENNANNVTSIVVHFGGGTFTGDLWLERVFA